LDDLVEYITAEDKTKNKPSKKGNKTNNNHNVTNNNKKKNNNNNNNKLNQNNSVIEHLDKEFELFKQNIEKDTIHSININKIKPNLNKDWLKTIIEY
jgi:hypothetical protein